MCVCDASGSSSLQEGTGSLTTCGTRQVAGEVGMLTDRQNNEQTSTPTYIYTYIHTYKQRHKHTHMHTYIQTCKHTYIHRDIFRQIYVCIYTRVCFLFSLDEMLQHLLVSTRNMFYVNMLSVLQCVAVCCSVLQCVAVCCSFWFRQGMCSVIDAGTKWKGMLHLPLKE